MKKIYKLYLMLLLFAVGGVNVLAQKTLYDNPNNYSTQTYEVGDENVWNNAGIFSFQGDQEYRGKEGGLRGSTKGDRWLKISGLAIGDKVSIKYAANASYANNPILFKSLNAKDEIGNNVTASTVMESEKSYTITGDDILELLIRRYLTIYSITIQSMKDVSYNIDINNGTFSFSEGSSGRLKNRTVTIPHMTMTFGNTEIGNLTWINEKGATIYDTNGNGWLWYNEKDVLYETSPYYQGSFYIFKPYTDGTLSLDCSYTRNTGNTGNEIIFNEIGTTQETTFYFEDINKTKLELSAGHTYCLHATNVNILHLKGFTFTPILIFEKASDICSSGTSYQLPLHPDQNRDVSIEYTCEGKGKFKTTPTVSNDNYVHWTEGDAGAIVVTANYTVNGKLHKSQFVLTLPYTYNNNEFHEWVFDKSKDTESNRTVETKKEMHANTSSEKEWTLAWKVYRHEVKDDDATGDANKGRADYYTELERPVFSNNVEIDGDNARFLSATAGLIFKAPEKSFGANIPVTPYYADKDGKRYWGYGYDDDENTKRDLLTVSEISEFLQKTHKAYNLGDEYVKGDDKGDAVTIQVGSKLTIPHLQPGQHIRIRWNRHNPNIGELMRAFNVTDLEGTSMHGKLFNLGAGSHNTTTGHQEFIVAKNGNPNETGYVDVTFELVANGTNVDGTVIAGQQGWANIFSIKVGPVGEYLETHMKPAYVDEGKNYDSEAESIETPHKIFPYNNVNEKGKDEYERAGTYTFLRRAGKGTIKTKLDMYKEYTYVQGGSQSEKYKILPGTYTGTLSGGNCNVSEVLTEKFKPVGDEVRERGYQYLNIIPSAGATDITENEDTKINNADLSTVDSGWAYYDDSYKYQDWKTDGDVAVVEFYSQWNAGEPEEIDQKNFKFSQKVKLPAGDYRIAVNAFYRNGNGDGTNYDKAWIFAGDKKQNVAALSAAGVSAYDGEKDIYRAANAFSKGDFSNSFEFSLDKAQEIELGIQGYFDLSLSWCILGPVKLYKYTPDDNAHGSFMMALESRQISGYNYCKNDFLLDSVHVKVNVFEYDYNVKPYPYTWAMEHFTTETGNNTIASEELIGIDDKNKAGYWTKNSNQYQFNIGYPENMIAWKKVTEKGKTDNTATYEMKAGEKMVSGQTVPVLNGAETVATITFGERIMDENGNKAKPFSTFTDTEKHLEYYFTRTDGNGIAGNQKGGTFYTIIPKYDGRITIAVYEGNGQTIYVKENGNDFCEIVGQGDQIYEFNVKESQHYKIYAENSPVGFYGLTYTYNTGGELYVPEMDGLGIIPAKYWDKEDKTITLEPNDKGLILAYNDEENTQSGETSTDTKGHTLIIPNLKKGNTVYFAATGDGSITEATKTDVKGKIDGNTEVDIYKYVATQDEGNDVKFVVNNLNIYKIAVSVDTKDVYCDTGYATEAREYPLDMTLANVFLGKVQKAYTVTGVNDEYVAMKEIKFVPMAIDSNDSYKNGVIVSGKLTDLKADDKTQWPLFTTDIDQVTEDMTGNNLIGVVAQDNLDKNVEQGEKDGDNTYYNYMLANRGYNVKYNSKEDAEDPEKPGTVVGKLEYGVGFYLVMATGTKLDNGESYKGGKPKNNSAYMKLDKWLAKQNNIKEENSTNTNEAGIHQVFYIDVDSLATGIDEVLIDDELPTTGDNSSNLLNDGVFYTLQGIPVKNPTKGIYIFNGKKVYVK